MKNSIKIPSVQFGDKYSALNRNSEEVFSAITEKTSDLGFSCYLKEKNSAISKTDGNYKRCEDIVKVTITVKGKNIVKTINGYYSSLEMKILLSENDIFNFLASCTKKEKIVQVVWNDVISNVGSKIVSRNIERQSLCRVIGLDENGMRRLKRLGDITVDGYIQPFIYNDELPPFFENRKTIFWKDGPGEEGFVGVWDWSAIPNKSGADSDYVESKFNKDVTPTEIIEISKAHNIDSLIDYLKQGVEEKPSCINVIFAYKVVKGGYEGVLCNNKILEIKDDKTYLNKEVNSLMAYFFNEEDILKTKTQEFYRYLRLDDYDRLVLTKSPVEIVRNIVLKRASWSAGKQFEMTKNEWKSFKGFLESIVDDTFYQDIVKECDCDENDAKSYFEEFLSVADEMLDSNDMDISILSKVVEHSDALKAQCEKLVEEKWLETHSKDIKKAKEELELITKDVNKSTNELNALNKEIKDKKQILAKLDKDTKKYDELGDQVLSRIKEKLNAAKNDVSDFVSELTILSTAIGGSQSVGNYSTNCYTVGKVVAGELSDSYLDSIDCIADELVEAGVDSKYSYSFACFLYSLYVNKINLLLAGPNSESIAHAFSTGLYGRYAGVIDCNAKYDSELLDKIITGEDKIILFKNAFSNGWIYNLVEAAQSTDKLFVYSNPIVEDLIIEPKGLYNYFVPVITDLFVGTRPSNNFIGSVMSDNYEEYTKQKKQISYSSYFKRINISNYLSEIIQNVISDFHNLYNDSDVTADYMYILFAYAYATGNGSAFAERIRIENTVNNDKLNMMLGLLGVTDD